jgi:uncharacterized membrane protein
MRTALLFHLTKRLQRRKHIPVWRQFLHEGWFPFFPWIGVSLLGAFVGSFKFKTAPEVFNKNLLLGGGIMFALGIAMWIELYARRKQQYKL